MSEQNASTDDKLLENMVEIDRVDCRRIADLAIDRKLIFVPKQLHKESLAYSRKASGRETMMLVYSLIGCRTRFRKWSYINNNSFLKIAGSEAVNRAKNWLDEHGWIKREHAYSEGNYSKQYRACNLRNQIPIELTIKSSSCIFEHRDHVAADPACEYTKEMLNLISIDDQQARKILAELIESYFGFSQSGITNNPGIARIKENCEQKRKLINKERILTSYLGPLHCLADRAGIRISRGQKGRRLYSPFTYLKRELRAGAIKFAGEKIVEIDCVCCQPSFLGNIVDDPSFLSDCLGDKFYEKIMNLLSVDRISAKVVFAAWAFGNNRNVGSRNACAFKCQLMMEREYPRVAEWVWNQKSSGNYKKLSWRMQRLESKLFIDEIYLTLARKRIPAISCHDAIFTLGSQVPVVQKIVRDAIEKSRYKLIVRSK